MDKKFMVNKIWAFMIFISIIFSIFTNKITVINNTIVESAKTSLDILFKIFPVLALWMGLTKIAEESKLLDKLAIKLSPIFNKIFKEIPKGHKSISLIASNIVANAFGLGSAATPFGLKAMQSLQSLNKNKEKASKSMITFVILNTSGFTVVPTAIISLRMLYGSVNPTNIVFICMLSTLISTVFGIIIDSIYRRRYKD